MTPNRRKATGYKGQNPRKKKSQYATKQYVQKQLTQQIDTKSHVYQWSGTISNSGTALNLLGPTAGTRISWEGHRFEILSITGFIQFTYADPSNELRYTVVSQQQERAAAPTFSQIYALADAYASPFNYEERLGQKVIMDRHVHLNDNSGKTVKRKFKIVKKNWVVTSPETESSGLYRGKNWPYIFISSDSSAMAHPECKMYIRVLYRDG